MMRQTDSVRLGTIIADRQLHVRGAPRRRVAVALGKPRRTRGSQDWECPFQITGAGIRYLDNGYGVDAFQALAMALEGIRYHLDRAPEPIVWGGGWLDDHTGFNRVIPILAEPGATRRLETQVDLGVRKWAKGLEQRYRKAGAAARRRSRESEKRR